MQGFSKYGGIVDGTRADSRRCRTRVAKFPLFASSSSGVSKDCRRPRTAGVYTLTSSKELRSREPMNTFETKVERTRMVASSADV